MPPIRPVAAIPLSSPEEESPYRLSINLFDLDNLDVGMRISVLSGKLNLNESIKVDLDRVSPSIAVPFKCNLLTAALAIDIIRSECRRLKEPPTRAYLNRGGEAWSRFPDNAVLTIFEDSKAILNPDIFREKEEILPLTPPAFEKVIIGGKK